MTFKKKLYVCFDGMTWADPRGILSDDGTTLEWVLRYGNPTKENLFSVASVLHCYQSLFNLSVRDRNKIISTIKRKIGEEL